jgi:UDP-glucose 4-epimerase
MRNILVTGGAGYIGSITAREMAQTDLWPIVYDSLEKGHREAVVGLDFVEGNINDIDQLKKVIIDKKIEGVIHFAAYIEVAESVVKPAQYFRNNTFGTLSLLSVLQECQVKYIVFSSTAAVYGNPSQVPITEESSKQPTNPYGESKLMSEKILGWFGQSHGLRSVILRYFNAAGATSDGQLGESHQPETHLIPNLITNHLKNQQSVIYGQDYPTKDGTAVRDYVHVLDLASYHIEALKYLFNGGDSDCFNIGTGQGYTNLEVVKAVSDIVGKKVDFRFEPRRTGDPATLIADNSKIAKIFGIQPKQSELVNIIKTAWLWHQNQRY